MSAPKSFIEADPVISEDARRIFTQYSKIPEDEILKHVRFVRDQAWSQKPYPSIGTWQFLELGIGETLKYNEVLQRIQSGERLLDLGCCVGQDIRKLVSNGAPSQNITGAELIGEYVDLGYELFRDKTTLQSRFVIGDFLTEERAGLQTGSFDMIYAGSFFHIFDWDKQLETITSTVQLLRSEPGSMVFGRQGAHVDGRAVQHSASYSGQFFAHNEQTFRKLIDEVATQTNVKLRCDAVLTKHSVYPEADGWRKLLFAIILA